MTTTTPVLWLRPGEQFLFLRDADAGNCDKADCGKPLTEGMFRWADWEPDPVFPGNNGQFPALRHTDGTPNCGAFMHAKPRCPECRGESLGYRDTGYGTVASCPCGWNQYTDRGD